MSGTRALIVLLVTAAVIGTAGAQDANQPTPPASADANAPRIAGGTDANEIRALVRSVKGICEKLDASRADANWAPVKVKDQLGAMTLVRTGLGAEMELVFSDRMRMTVRQATKMGIREFYKRGQRAGGRLGVKYGSIRAKVNSAAGENDFRVSTPVATLSVRGSGGTLAVWGDLGVYFRGQSGQWTLTTAEGDERAVTAGEWTDSDGTRSRELLSMFRHVPFGDPLGGLTRRELRFLREHGDGRGVIGFIGTGHQFTKLMAFDYAYSDDGGSPRTGGGGGSVTSP